MLRSLVAPLYLIASVGISYLAALGMSVIIFVKIGGSGGLVFFMPFLMFIFLLALGEDYNILVMTRIREEAHRLPLRQAVAKAVGVTGTTVTSAGLVLAGSFIVLTIAAGSGSGGEPGPRHRPRPGAGHPDGHLPGPHATGARRPWCCSASGTGGHPSCTSTSGGDPGRARGAGRAGAGGRYSRRRGGRRSR